MKVNKMKNRRPKEEEIDGFDFKKYEEEVISGLMLGKGLLGEEGLLKPLIARFIETALDAELNHHLLEENAEEGKSNKRNACPETSEGKRSKKVRSEAGELEITYNRDRQGSFEPITVGK
jgi:putative transposase